MTLTKEQVELLDAEGVETALKQFHKAHKVDKPITPEVWANLDPVVNTLLWLEEHQAYLKLSAMAVHANQVRWANRNENESNPA